LSISSHFSTRCFQVRCKLANYVSKFGNWFGRTFQCLNYCKQMVIVQVEINNSMESSNWSSVLYQEGLYFIELVIIIEYQHLFIQTKFKHWNELANFFAKFAPNFRTCKHNWQVRNELGNRALKNDLKSTIIRLVIKAYYNS
jgi:hypothetical protein